MASVTATGSFPELIAQNFPHGEDIQQALQMLGFRLAQGMEKGTKSTLVLILEREDGNAVMVVAKDGENISKPAPFALAVGDVADKGRRFASAMARR